MLKVLSMIILMQSLAAQVVTASPGVRTSVPNVTIDSSGRPQVSVASTLASALTGTIKVAPSSTAQQQALLSQVLVMFSCEWLSDEIKIKLERIIYWNSVTNLKVI
jgi:hypothetical protein